VCALQARIDRFVGCYNTRCPHWVIKRATRIRACTAGIAVSRAGRLEVGCADRLEIARSNPVARTDQVALADSLDVALAGRVQ